MRVARSSGARNASSAMLELRWIALAALAAVELVWGIDVLTVPDGSAQRAGLIAAIVGSAENFLKFAIAFSAVFALILSRQFAQLVGILRDQAAYRWWPWVVCHGIALAAFLWVSQPVFGPSGDMEKASAPWLLAWLATGSLTFAFLLLYDGLSNELKEFWPDIRRKVFHKDTP